MAGKPDWEEIKAEYIAGNISQRDLAAEHDVPYKTLQQRAVREKWTEERNQTRGEIGAKIAKTITDAKIKKIEKIVDSLLSQAMIASKQLKQVPKKMMTTEKTPEGTVIVTVKHVYEDSGVVDVGALKALAQSVSALDETLRKQRMEDKGFGGDNTIRVVFDDPEDEELGG